MKRSTAFLLCLLLVVSLCACGGEKWPTTGLAAKLPAPKSGKITHISDRDDSFYASVEGKNLYDDYVAACKEAGYTVDPDTSLDYEAFNEEGYKLSVTDYTDSIHIDLDAPIQLGTLKWPNSELGKAVPKPSSQKGNTEWEHEDSFLIYVGDMSIDDFDDYADTCSDAGFSVDYSRGDRYYYAYDKDGRYISIKYYGFNIVSIDAKLKDSEDTDEGDDDTGAEKAEETEKPQSKQTDAPESKAPAAADSEVTPEFKDMMDEYETFMNSYVEFMKKYKDSDDTVGMLNDYTDMMSQYAEYMSKVNAVDTDELSDADLAYYLEVTQRVNEKLLTVSQ